MEDAVVGLCEREVLVSEHFEEGLVPFAPARLNVSISQSSIRPVIVRRDSEQESEAWEFKA